MRKVRLFIRYLWLTLVTVAVFLLWGRMFGFDPVSYAYASFNASPQTWSSAYELDPTATDPVTFGDDHLRQAKIETRRRGTVEHDWSNIAVFGNDTGRHYEGSAKTFFRNTAPTVDGTMSAACLIRADTAGNRGCDEGRLWVDQDGADGVLATGDDNTIFGCDDTDGDGDCDAWEPLNAPLDWILISTCTATNSATCSFTGLSTYAQLNAVLDEIVPATDAVDLLFRVSTDNGATYDTSAVYSTAGSVTSNFPGSSTASSGTATSCNLTGAVANFQLSNSLGGVSGNFSLIGLGGASPLAPKSIGSFVHPSSVGGFLTISAIGCMWNGTGPINAIRFMMSSGNITSGAIRLYGRRSS